MPKKLELETLSDKAHAEIRRSLMAGRFVPGDILVIRTLAGRYGISATPIRDALQRLVAENSLEVLANRSIAVPHLTRAKFIELRRIRTALEGMAAKLALANLAEREIGRLSTLVESMDKDVAANDVRSYLVHNKEFHFYLYARADSPYLLQVIEKLWTQVGPFFNGLFESSRYLPHANEHHRQIIAAIQQRKGAMVRRAVIQDIEAAGVALMQRLVAKDS
ncbi:MAG: GntR family transcriptional regulator [Proteobacteria bacterium]|nr:GntR family transcriptional regulator [Pseudomonadota bacterium]